MSDQTAGATDAPIYLLDHGYLRLVETWGNDERIVEAAKQAGIDPPFGETNPDEMAFLTPDQDVTTTIDCVNVIGRKRDALRAHHSQISDDWPQLTMPDEVLRNFADEYFQLAMSRKPAVLPENDLFAGITASS